MSDFELESEDELPANKRFENFDQLVGHTIKAVFTDTSGRFDVSLVIVTETGCWLAADAENGSFDEAASFDVVRPYARSYYSTNEQPTLHDYVPAIDLFRAGVVNKGVYEHLKGIEAERDRAAIERRANDLRRQLEALESKSS